MDESQEECKVLETEEELFKLTQMAAGAVLPMVVKTAIELDLFKIMAKVTNDDGQFTCSDIVSHIPTQNSHQTLTIIERILRYLAAKSFLTSKIVTDEHGNTSNLFVMTSICKYFATNDDASSLSNMFLFLNDKAIMESWYYLKDAIIEGGTSFNIAHGVNIFEYQAKDERFREKFSKAMYGSSAILMKMVLDKYNGFEGVKTMVDVGGGLGATLMIILSKYPHIKAINFDMPDVVKDAPSVLGVEHVGGDMFCNVPKGDVILLKWILHDWGDENCIKILKNCWAALPKNGKVILIESIIPTNNEKNGTMFDIECDMVMLALNPGGKERTSKEYGALARECGFASSDIVCRVCYCSIMEFYKNID